jgi:hypothetical protein
MKSKIIDSRWYGGVNSAGIVKTQNRNGEIAYYIGSQNYGDSPREVADYGGIFPKEIGDIIFGCKE